jgi:hypothetical protein
VRTSHRQTRPPRIGGQVGAVTHHHAQEVNRQRDERGAAGTDGRVAAHSHEHGSRPGGAQAHHHKVIDRVGGALLKPHLDRGDVLAEPAHRPFPQQRGEQGGSVGVLQHGPAAGGVRTCVSFPAPLNVTTSAASSTILFPVGNHHARHPRQSGRAALPRTGIGRSQPGFVEPGGDNGRDVVDHRGGRPLASRGWSAAAPGVGRAAAGFESADHVGRGARRRGGVVYRRQLGIRLRLFFSAGDSRVASLRRARAVALAVASRSADGTITMPLPSKDITSSRSGPAGSGRAAA